jgi:hypothetical protein
MTINGRQPSGKTYHVTHVWLRPEGWRQNLRSAVQVTKIMAPLILPGAALVNHLPFCAVSDFHLRHASVAHSYFQCGTFLHGSHTSATNHWRE